ncbi:cytochrome b [Nisaea acidiphila]|uniref:Cytochrome b n=1 Tax=Nisaea acidiphila TaxID=1862145 RepID=A0A9J7AY23_9PROT|nr:cytochrome b [Nisaea acidiphila]UUX51698.1 cytochrome b [Nisaea acidiphila]
MQVKNNSETYGLPSRALHWGMAVAIVAMFALGVWMVTLDYYSPYYRLAPDIHRGTGILLLGLLTLRFVWRLFNVDPDRNQLTRIERRGAELAHWGFYPLLLALMGSGYFISTADGRPIDVFGLFSVPAMIKSPGMEQAAGAIHEVLAYLTMALAALHALAALKHHLIDRDRTLLRMLRSGPTSLS